MIGTTAARPGVLQRKPAWLDLFTLDVPANPAVTAIHQDPLGLRVRLVRRNEATFVLVKLLQNRAVAVGLCNAGEIPVTVTVRGSQIPELRRIRRTDVETKGATGLLPLRTRHPG